MQNPVYYFLKSRVLCNERCGILPCHGFLDDACTHTYDANTDGQTAKISITSR